MKQQSMTVTAVATMTALAVLLWTAAGSMLIFAVSEDQALRLSQIALFVQLAACIPTMYLVINHILARHRQIMLEQLSEIVGRADAERAIRRLREVSH